MGCGNPPAMPAAEDWLDELSLSTIPNGANGDERTQDGKSFQLDGVISSSTSSGYAHFPRDIHGHRRPDQPTNLSISNDSKANETPTSAKRDLSEFRRESGTFYPNSSLSEIGHVDDGGNIVHIERLMDTGISSTGYRPEGQMNYFPSQSGRTTTYPIKEHGAEAKKIRRYMSPLDGNFSSSESSTSAFRRSVTGNENDINSIQFPIRTPQEVDGNFLTLGIGSGQEKLRSNNNFNPREITSKLDNTGSLKGGSLNVGQSRNNTLMPTELIDRFARIEPNSSGLSSSASNLAGRMPTFDERGHVRNTDPGLISNRFLGFQNPQTNVQPVFTENYNSFVFDQAPSSFQFRSSPASQSERVRPISFGPVMMSPQFPSQSIPQNQVQWRKSYMNVSSGSLRNNPSNWYRGSSLHHARPGELIPPVVGRGTQSSAGVHFLPRGNLTSPPGGTGANISTYGSAIVQPIGHLRTSQNNRPVHSHGHSNPEAIQLPDQNRREFHSTVAGPFPRRLGLQPTDFSSAQTNIGNQRPVRHPFVYGQPTNLPPWVNPFSSPLSSGQPHHGMPTQFRQVPPAAKFNARPQIPPIVPRPSLKRPATENPPAIHSGGPHKKIFPQPTIRPSAPYKRQAIRAPIPATVQTPPSSVPYIKWQGFQEQPLEPTGEKCLLCKRDLLLTPEGPVNQPPNPPEVAVLPCGHTFHDHCLSIITPEEESKDPPCIPCALGES